MLELCGKSVSKGIAIGKIYFHSNINNVPKYEVENPEKELERYKKALVLAKEAYLSAGLMQNLPYTALHSSLPTYSNSLMTSIYSKDILI